MFCSGRRTSYLLRPTSHGNDVSVFYLAPSDVYRKVTSSAKGMRFIESEREGLRWYASRLGESPACFIKSYCTAPSYSRLDLQTIGGTRLNYMSPLRSTARHLELCVDHYVTTWPKEATVPCHGDLTLDNVFFLESGPRFFDWEHFKPNGEQWGFDIAYLILFAGSSPYALQGRLPKEDRAILCRLWRKLIDNGLNGFLSRQPLDYFRNVFQGSAHWRNIVEASPKKLFPLRLDRDFGNDLHSIINGTLR